MLIYYTIYGTFDVSVSGFLMADILGPASDADVDLLLKNMKYDEKSIVKREEMKKSH